MSIYAAKVMGWMWVGEAKDKREATRIAKAAAPSCSLLPSDVHESHIRPATEEDVAWYASMGGKAA